MEKGGAVDVKANHDSGQRLRELPYPLQPASLYVLEAIPPF
jgi:hypothetical protein